MPLFVDASLWLDEFAEDTDLRVLSMLRALFSKIDKALATDAGDMDHVEFKYYRMVSTKATKAKPIELKAELYMNPDYGVVWALVSLA